MNFVSRRALRGRGIEGTDETTTIAPGFSFENWNS